MASRTFANACALFAATAVVTMATAMAQEAPLHGVAPPSSAPAAEADVAAPARGDAEALDVGTSPVEIRMHREPLRQFGRGIANVLTGAWEIPKNMFSVNRDMGDCAGFTYGLLRGVWRFGCREVTGVFEIVTFPFGWQPIIEPEFYMEPMEFTEWRVTWPPQWSQQPGF